MASRKVEQKRQRVSEEILQSATRLIEDGSYHQMTVRELCAEMGISTGLFYRHFKAKNDLLSLYSIEQFKKAYQEECPSFCGKSLREQLLRLCMLSVESNFVMGPESIVIHINNDNPICDCSVSRGQFEECVCELWEAAVPSAQFHLEEAQRIATHLIIVQKGLCFEWYSKRNDPNFDYLAESERILRQTIDSLDLPDGVDG